MQYAWPKSEKEKTDLSKRIEAKNHKGKEAVCPLHGCRVRSVKLNRVWQWVHIREEADEA